ncbi:hypothetical protein ACS0TY_007101 [Phlomoides rotata]
MVFKKSISGRSPVRIFTNQDLAITKAIEKNAVSRFADLKYNDTFKETFNKCLTGCKDRGEFENCWK